jgi:hypothetical protein
MKESKTKVKENDKEYTIITDEEGTKRWYLNNKLHREDGPAIEYENGDIWWMKDDLLHREDGPAIEYSDGTKEWCLNGKKYTEEQFLQNLKAKVVKTKSKVELDKAAEKEGQTVRSIDGTDYFITTTGKTPVKYVYLGEKRIMSFDQYVMFESKQINEKNSDLDANHEFGVVLFGGSLGQGRDIDIIVYKGRDHGVLQYTFKTKDEAKAKVAHMNALLSPGEKSYYKMRYSVIEITKQIKQEILDII